MASELGEPDPLAMLERIPAHVVTLWRGYFKARQFWDSEVRSRAEAERKSSSK